MNSDLNDKKPFRILALDGGGIKGTFTASILATWEKVTGLRIAEHFDLIAGTSTGGILALALGLGHSASSIQQFYEEHGPAIFPDSSFLQRLGLTVGHLWRPKYSCEPLRSALAQVFGEQKLGDSRCRLIIPTYDALRGRIFLMKTAHHPRLTFDHEAPAVDVALATSAAPTFFQPSQFGKHAGNPYIDGGVWANSPGLAAVVEAHHFLDVPLSSIRLLSIGTTTESTAILDKLNRGPGGLLNFGVLRWAPQLIGLLFQAQVQCAVSATSLLLSEGNFVRVDQVTPEGVYSLDSARKIEELCQLGRGRAVEKEILEPVRKLFLNGTPALPFQHFRSGTRT
ncbi:CBASS cGAMP-activated phospholipase [Silvibacterium acidisoli]|uniref:CBASS cGAMP-activated phospholipase n=1 Tax=Acidobacteriaceae bacterium ZG23-2 TaxID=2883246 RepID=UPI00406D01B6